MNRIIWNSIKLQLDELTNDEPRSRFISASNMYYIAWPISYGPYGMEHTIWSYHLDIETFKCISRLSHWIYCYYWQIEWTDCMSTDRVDKWSKSNWPIKKLQINWRIHPAILLGNRNGKSIIFLIFISFWNPLGITVSNRCLIVINLQFTIDLETEPILRYFYEYFPYKMMWPSIMKLHQGARKRLQALHKIQGRLLTGSQEFWSYAHCFIWFQEYIGNKTLGIY